jgi:hypothetical protein
VCAESSGFVLVEKLRLKLFLAQTLFTFETLVHGGEN